MPLEPRRFTLRTLLWMVGLFALSLTLMRLAVTGQVYTIVAGPLILVSINLFLVVACIVANFFVRGRRGAVIGAVIVVILTGLYVVVSVVTMLPTQ